MIYIYIYMYVVPVQRSTWHIYIYTLSLLRDDDVQGNPSIFFFPFRIESM